MLEQKTAAFTTLQNANVGGEKARQSQSSLGECQFLYRPMILNTDNNSERGYLIHITVYNTTFSFQTWWRRRRHCCSLSEEPPMQKKKSIADFSSSLSGNLPEPTSHSTNHWPRRQSLAEIASLSPLLLLHSTVRETITPPSSLPLLPIRFGGLSRSVLPPVNQSVRLSVCSSSAKPLTRSGHAIIRAEKKREKNRRGGVSGKVIGFDGNGGGVTDGGHGRRKAKALRKRKGKTGSLQRIYREFQLA